MSGGERLMAEGSKGVISRMRRNAFVFLRHLIGSGHLVAEERGLKPARRKLCYSADSD